MALRSLAGGLLVACVLLGCGSPPADESLDVNAPVIPAEAAGWTSDGPDDAYDTESIYGYIDGHAEVYLAYGMKRCVSRRYHAADGEGEIVVDLFEMASPSDAFGVFSHDRAGEVVEVGQGGVFRHGWLSFWDGSWYGSVYSTGGDESSRQAVLDVGAVVAEGLPGGGGVPELVSRLPRDGLDESTVCFLRSPQILNAHVFVGGDDLFGLGPKVEAVVASYDIDGTKAHLVVVRYPTESIAEEAENRARAAASGDDLRPAMVVGREGAVLAAVVGVEPTEQVESLLDHALGEDG